MIISVINNKGGVGKSTITQNLAHALANKGKRILVIDQDPQSNTSSVLMPSTGAHTLYNFYKDEAPAIECIYPTLYLGIDILPNSNKTDTIEVGLYGDLRKSYFLLRDNLRDHILKVYDIALIDCPPNLGIFVIMALICSDSAIVPIEAGSRYSVDGFVSAFEAIEGAAGAVQHPLKFLRAVINKVDLRATIHKSSVDYLRRVYDEKIFQTTIPTNTDIQKAEMERETVLRYAPHCNGTKRFKALADELLEIVNG
jgi:chromosome partitioning protein